MASDNCGFCGKPIVLTEQAKECKCGATNRELPTLTCSEVVERLRSECLVPVRGIGGILAGTTLDREKATAILHSWRERRVQELEERLAKRSGCSQVADSASGSTGAKAATETRMNWWTRLRRWWFRRQLPRTGREIDFTHRGWGHNITRCGDSFAVHCTPRIEAGDLIVTEKGRYLVASVEPCGDPPDIAFCQFIAETDAAEN